MMHYYSQFNEDDAVTAAMTWDGTVPVSVHVDNWLAENGFMPNARVPGSDDWVQLIRRWVDSLVKFVDMGELQVTAASVRPGDLLKHANDWPEVVAVVPGFGLQSVQSFPRYVRIRFEGGERAHRSEDLVTIRRPPRQKVQPSDQGKVTSPHAPDTEVENPVNDPLKWSSIYNHLTTMRSSPTTEALWFLFQALSAQQAEIDALRKER